MYRVIIVDDEIWSVIGLKKILEEDGERFRIIYETTDSLDALEKICEKRPDLVFTDVRMPDMSGIELMRNVRQRGIRTEFVVISGFAEFTYVQQALQEGAMDYQLKPFDRGSAKVMLDKIAEKLDGRKNISDLEFYTLLRDKKSNVANLLLGRFGQPLYRYLQIVLLYGVDGSTRPLPLDPGADAQCLVLNIGPRKWLYIINSQEDTTETLHGQLSAQTGSIEISALSTISDSMDQFELLLNEAEITLRDSFVYPREKIFRHRKMNRAYINRMEKRIADLYAGKKYQQIASVVDGLCKVFSENNLCAEDAVYFWNRITMYSPNGDRADGQDVLDIYELTDRFANLQEMSSFLKEQYQSKLVEQSDTANDKFFEMLRYIDNNYSEHLSLKELCNDFYINMSYCCELFQKHKNMTFSQYLTDVRINKACELLRYHKATVSEACELVGYKDYFYFSKVFKKKMGTTPAAYRKNELTES